MTTLIKLDPEPLSSAVRYFHDAFVALHFAPTEDNVEKLDVALAEIEAAAAAMRAKLKL